MSFKTFLDRLKVKVTLEGEGQMIKWSSISLFGP